MNLFCRPEIIASPSPPSSTTAPPAAARWVAAQLAAGPGTRPGGRVFLRRHCMERGPVFSRVAFCWALYSATASWPSCCCTFLDSAIARALAGSTGFLLMAASLSPCAPSRPSGEWPRGGSAVVLRARQSEIFERQGRGSKSFNSENHHDLLRIFCTGLKRNR
jgi:hypothetical protein